MIRYMMHALWPVLRPFIRPFWRMRQRTVEEREREVALYKREQQATLRELKIELALAHRQGIRDQLRQHESQAGNGGS